MLAIDRVVVFSGTFCELRSLAVKENWGLFVEVKEEELQGLVDMGKNKKEYNVNGTE